MQQPQPYTPPSGTQISPGSITYTTSTGSDGRVIYHPFRYDTPQGIVHGIQWVPAEATQILPSGAQPANAEFAASWNRGMLSRDDEKALHKWQREEEKRRKREEKDAAKRLSRIEHEEQEIRLARERDALQERRRSMNYSPIPPSATGYPNPGSAAYGAYTTADLDRKFTDLAIERKELERERRKYSDVDRNRRASGNFGADRSSVYSSPGATYTSPTGYPTAGYNPTTSPYRPAGAYPTSPNVRSAEFPSSMTGYSSSTYPTASIPAEPIARAASPYARAPSPYARPPDRAPSPYARAASPYARPPDRAPSPYARAASPYGRPPDRAPSPYARAASPYGRPPDRAPSPYARVASPYARPPDRAPSPYARAPSPYSRPPDRAPSPYARAASPYARAPSPYRGPPTGSVSGVYPRGHILEGQPIRPGSRAPSPMPPPGTFPTASFTHSPRVPMASVSGEQQLAAPEGFSRPPNAAQSYTPFNIIRIQDMEEFYDQIPRMPLVLDTHDVYHEDWIRFMNDLALAWAGKMPIPEFSRGPPPKRSALVADLVDLWNSSFFLTRRAEAVLYKGRERRSGPNAGTIDHHLPAYDLDNFSDSSDSSESTSDDDSENDRYPVYGRSTPMRDAAEAKRRRREKKEEQKRRKKDKKLRKKAKEIEKRYTLYISYAPPREGTIPGGLGLYA
ncbi:hypothetical protein SERLA73DRAFT_166188 [Serpula lacrymans var. lacrymans S7.3]|uniref:Uncharacterized protein n=1 Tax=Serpula lacrymans var. lacrymans (strain S7.3) TaxID=936435 RepID=F8PQY6_SERL3|nr:hypothetical protein SERLA73DRAFT_166188 [Serpula lacrymans var. lacrymans S7.3]